LEDNDVHYAAIFLTGTKSEGWNLKRDQTCLLYDQEHIFRNQSKKMGLLNTHDLLYLNKEVPLSEVANYGEFLVLGRLKWLCALSLLSSLWRCFATQAGECYMWISLR
jgi:hypothetical protein